MTDPRFSLKNLINQISDESDLLEIFGKTQSKIWFDLNQMKSLEIKSLRFDKDFQRFQKIWFGLFRFWKKAQKLDKISFDFNCKNEIWFDFKNKLKDFFECS